jgi:membrane-associated HD superfamily phosphohydrolase
MENVMAQQSLMKNRKFWIPILVSVPVTGIFAIISAVNADFGFATYDAAMIFFPYMMLTVLWLGMIHPLIGIASLFQWPLYGAIIGRAWAKGRLVLVVEILLLIHIAAAVLTIKFIKYSNRQPIGYTSCVTSEAYR